MLEEHRFPLYLSRTKEAAVGRGWIRRSQKLQKPLTGIGFGVAATPWTWSTSLFSSLTKDTGYPVVLFRCVP
jgi:hypothetical protein